MDGILGSLHIGLCHEVAILQVPKMIDSAIDYRLKSAFRDGTRRAHSFFSFLTFLVSFPFPFFHFSQGAQVEVVPMPTPMPLKV